MTVEEGFLQHSESVDRGAAFRICQDLEYVLM